MPKQNFHDAMLGLGAMIGIACAFGLGFAAGHKFAIRQAELGRNESTREDLRMRRACEADLRNSESEVETQKRLKGGWEKLSGLCSSDLERLRTTLVEKFKASPCWCAPPGAPPEFRQ